MKGAIIIPARYESSRFRGKPLAMIGQRTMIQCVYDRCCDAVPHSLVYVATDDARIADVVTAFGGKVVMTSDSCMTGTDRLAEANESLELDFVINVQGDEPLVNPAAVKKVFDMMSRSTDCVVNAYSIVEGEDLSNPNVPKLVVSNSESLLYMSRGGVPFTKRGAGAPMNKQVCIYGFGREHLKLFSLQGGKTPNEAIEDIEILRFLDLDIPVKMVKVEGGTVAVDTLEDLFRVGKLLNLPVGPPAHGR